MSYNTGSCRWWWMTLSCQHVHQIDSNEYDPVAGNTWPSVWGPWTARFMILECSSFSTGYTGTLPFLILLETWEGCRKFPVPKSTSWLPRWLAFLCNGNRRGTGRYSRSIFCTRHWSRILSLRRRGPSGADRSCRRKGRFGRIWVFSWVRRRNIDTFPRCFWLFVRDWSVCPFWRYWSFFVVPWLMC